MIGVNNKKYMKCNYCSEDAEWVENKEVYGKNYGKSYMIFLCRKCDAYVGCHQNTKNPLGRMSNKEERELKKEVKGLYLDMFEKYGKRWYYKHLAEILDIPMKEAHFGMFDKNRLLKLRDLLINKTI